MLQISGAVMDSFQAEATKRVVCWHSDRLLARFPVLSSRTPEQHYAFAARNRLRAIGMGIEAEEDIATFLDCTVMYGEDFIRKPWASEILELGELPGGDRAELLRVALADIGVAL